MSLRSLACAIVLTVLAVDPWGFAPFGPLRFALLSTLVLAGLAIATRQPLVLERRTAWLWSALLGWLLLATALAVDPLHAWIGTPDRRLGWLTWLLFAAAFVIGQQLDARGALALVRTVALAATVGGAVAVCERAGARLVDVRFADDRVGATFGQPSYLAAFAVLALPVAVGLAAHSAQPRTWRLVGLAGTLGATAALLLAETRGAWLGLAAAVVVLVRRPRVLAAVVGAAVVVVVVVGLTPLDSRVDRGGDSRLDEWSLALDTIADRPVLGAGPEGYRVVVGANVTRDYERSYGRTFLPDRAHNAALDVAAVGGVPAAAIYVALLAIVALAAWRSAGTGAPSWRIGLAAGLVAYGGQQLFLFPLSELDPLAWLLAGAAMSAASTRTTTARVPRPAAYSIAALAALAAVAGALDVAADRSLAGAATLADADRATALRPDSIRNWFVASRIAREGGTIRDVDHALDRIDSGLDRSPRDPALLTERSDLLLDRARRSGSAADVGAAVDALTQLVADDQNNALHRLRLGIALALDDELDRATEEFERAVDLAPRDAEPLANLAALELQRGDVDAAADTARRALEVDPAQPLARAVLDQIGQS